MCLPNTLICHSVIDWRCTAAMVWSHYVRHCYCEGRGICGVSLRFANWSVAGKHTLVFHRILFSSPLIARLPLRFCLLPPQLLFLIKILCILSVTVGCFFFLPPFWPPCLLDSCVISFSLPILPFSLIRPFWGFFLFAWLMFFLNSTASLLPTLPPFSLSRFSCSEERNRQTRTCSRISCQFEWQTPSVTADFALLLPLWGPWTTGLCWQSRDLFFFDSFDLTSKQTPSMLGQSIWLLIRQ